MKRLVFFAGMLGAVLTVLPASANVVIDFGTGTSGTTGTITSLGGGNYQGSGIALGVLTVSGDPGFNGIYDTYGTGTGDLGDSNGSAVLAFNTATGAVTVTGGVCISGNITCNGGAGTLVSSTTLVNGTGAANILSVSATVGGGFSLLLSEPDQKASTLLTALGLPVDLQFALMNLSVQGVTDGGSGWSSDSTDAQNQSVPEPTSIVLLGTVLMSVTGLVRRRARKA